MDLFKKPVFMLGMTLVVSGCILVLSPFFKFEISMRDIHQFLFGFGVYLAGWIMLCFTMKRQPEQDD